VIPFEKMRSLRLVAVEPQLARAQAVIKLLTGETIRQDVTDFSGLYGSNSVGPFHLDGSEVEHVEFRR
jgi:hypothetical protein